MVSESARYYQTQVADSEYKRIGSAHAFPILLS